MLYFRLFLASIMIASVASLVAQSNPVPFVNQPLAPSAIVPGIGSSTLRVNGAGFVLGSVVNWNGNALETTFVNPDQLTALIPAENITEESTASITVTNPIPGGGISNAVPLAVTSPMTSLTFAPSTYNVGNSVIDVIAGDFNNDGKKDLAILNSTGIATECPNTAFPTSTTGSITILLGNGNGTFTTKFTYELMCIRASLDISGISLMKGDFNGDGKMDLGVVFYEPSEHDQLGTFLGNGDGTFTYVSTPFTADGFTGRPITADFNGDGMLDMVLPTFGLPVSGIVALYGDGDGTFHGGLAVLQWDFVISCLVTGDFNGDGALDLASSLEVPQPNGAYSPIYLGRAGGGFTAAPSQPSTSIGPGLTTADFNNDGLLDLAFFGSSGVSVLLGNGDGSFGIKRSTTAAISSKMSTADLNGDGKLDLIVPNLSNNTISVLRGKGNGTFQPAITYPVVGGPVAIAIADFNGDGKLDMVSANGDSTVTVFLNTSARRSVTTTLLSSSINPAVYGQRVGLTATVTSTGPGTPTGRVQFLASGETIGSVTLNSGGIATLANLTLSAGSYSLSAVYSGNTAALESTSSVEDQIVNQATTTATITSSKNPSVSGKAVTFTATITSPTLSPKGTVVFMSGTTVLGNLQLSGGKARLSISSLPVGSNPITVTYSGDANIVGSSANLAQVIK